MPLSASMSEKKSTGSDDDDDDDSESSCSSEWSYTDDDVEHSSNWPTHSGSDDSSDCGSGDVGLAQPPLLRYPLFESICGCGQNTPKVPLKSEK